jgi:cell pole-organizing protein PopZ
MDETSEPIRRIVTDTYVEPISHVAGVSVVPPEDSVVDDASKASMLSHETSAAVGTAFDTLTQAVRKQNSQTLEDLVREILQPRLASWLDDNLPGLVERTVRTEIERIARER